MNSGQIFRFNFLQNEGKFLRKDLHEKRTPPLAGFPAVDTSDSR